MPRRKGGICWLTRCRPAAGIGGRIIGVDCRGRGCGRSRFRVRVRFFRNAVRTDLSFLAAGEKETRCQQKAQTDTAVCCHVDGSNLWNSGKLQTIPIELGGTTRCIRWRCFSGARQEAVRGAGQFGACHLLAPQPSDAEATPRPRNGGDGAPPSDRIVALTSPSQMAPAICLGTWRAKPDRFLIRDLVPPGLLQDQ
jgi:hypothetical protein